MSISLLHSGMTAELSGLLLVGFCLLLTFFSRAKLSQKTKLLVSDYAGVSSHLRIDHDPHPATQPTPSITTLATILQNAAATPNSLHVYTPGQTGTARVVTYRNLYDTALENAARLEAVPGWELGKMCLIDQEDHLSNIIWFWSVVLAGGIPTMSPPLAPSDAEMKLQHLSRVLSNPICLTTRSRLPLYTTNSTLIRGYAVDALPIGEDQPPRNRSTVIRSLPTLPFALVMLTSGSSGNAKAVPLSHQQVLSCVNGKAHALTCRPGTTILNWVSMDHVAGLVEAHIRALVTGVDQIHAEAHDIVSNPMLFLELLARHRVSSSFAPHFLLARLVEGITSGELRIPDSLDLTCLRTLASGGEACTTETCRRLTDLLRPYGAPANVITPGFGMTETGAGCIFGRACPSSDLEKGYEFASVGRCVPGVEMRITSLNDAVSAAKMHVQNTNVVGNLEVRGPIVFNGYLNNPEANRESFTRDGWFRTGDMGFIDEHGHLSLTGRTKDVICINGVKYSPVDQERSIEDAKIPGVQPGYVVCFDWRPAGASTEQCCVVYQHSYDTNDTQARAQAQRQITKVVLLSTGTRPHVLPLPAGYLHKSSLGKLSRPKIKQAFQQGTYAAEDVRNSAMIKNATKGATVRPSNHPEQMVLDIVCSTLQLDPSEIGIDTPFFDAGVTSIDLIRMKSRIQEKFSLSALGVETMILHNTVRSLTEAIQKLTHGRSSAEYQPVVQLKSTGSKAPLWLIHPGVGEVLVFVGLAQYVEDRPVLALRARGFEEGEEAFKSIDETVTQYVSAIRSRQPHGPYAIAGYSYGSMLAFEVAKRLEAMGEEVPFLGCLNLPPHIKTRMRQLSLNNCLIHLALFLQLIDDDQSATLEKETATVPFETAMDTLLSVSDGSRIQELDIGRSGLAKWATVAFALQSMATDYEPTGSTRAIDVFYCDPLAIAARSKDEWLHQHLAKWRDFCRTAPRFHSVGGAHYTMISPTHVQSFHKTLARVLAERGI